MSLLEDCVLGVRALAAKRPADINTKEDLAALRGVLSGCQRLGLARVPAELPVVVLELLGRAELPLEAHMLAGTALCHCLPAAELLRLLLVPQDSRISLCLCHGLVSAAQWVRRSAASPALLEELYVRAMFRTLHPECVRLSRLTPLAFKVLAVWLQRLAALELRLPCEYADELMVLVSGSWEVPMSGARESNGRALAGLLDLAAAGLLAGEPPGPARWLLRPQELLEAVLLEQPWTAKSKYFLLCVLLRGRRGGPVPEGLPQGLLLGVASSHLVSAASDVYAVVLRCASLAAWRDAFLEPVAHTLVASTNRLLVQNILNHWIQPTVKAFPESLGEILEELRARTPERSVTARLALTFVLGLARREGLWDIGDSADTDSWQWEAVTKALRHSDKGVRSYALSAVCDCGRAFQPVSEREAAAVRAFLQHNVNLDCAALRQSALGSLSWLLMRARNSGDSGAARLLAWLHAFLLDCLEPGTNYQRRITALSAYLMVVRLLDPAARPAAHHTRKAVSRARASEAVLEQYRHFGSECSLRTLLLCAADPTDDIREAAADILVECGAFRDLAAGGLAAELSGRALSLCGSQLFYEAESGALVAKVVATWEGAAESLSEAALLEECESQLAALRRDVLGAATSGSPLHGVLTALRRVAPAAPPSAALTARLLALLEGTTEHCLALLASTSSTEFAPSFAEMGEAIDKLVAESIEDEEEILTLTPAHQLVLNCIWLNLKACCGLACQLAGRLARCSPSAPEAPEAPEAPGRPDAAAAERCARLLVAVLTRCRHKGAIEAAGLAVQNLVRSLTQPPLHTELCELPLRLLRDFLALLLEGRTAAGTSVSRRSAGLGILVHRIVVGDQQPDKPLLGECMSKLLAVLSPSPKALRAPSAAPLAPAPAPEQHDTAEAQALHFLRMLVADAGLRMHMAPHLSRVALLCFQHLTSPVWSIRNAGLQLFGAIVPKLVGQKKCSDEQEVVGDTAVDELSLRYPELLAALLSRLEAVGNSMREHAQVIPLLSLLSRVSVPSSVLGGSGLHATITRFKIAFLYIFDSPIAVVRTLAAKAYARFTPVSESSMAFKKLSLEARLRGENRQVGCLTAMDFLKKRIQTDGLCLPLLRLQTQEMKSSLKELEPSFDWKLFPSLKHALFLNLIGLSHPDDWKHILKMVEKSLEMTHLRGIVGIDQWRRACVLQAMSVCQECDVSDVFQTCLKSSYKSDITRFSIQVLLKRLSSSTSPNVLRCIANVSILFLLRAAPPSSEDFFNVVQILSEVISRMIDYGVNFKFEVNFITELSKNYISVGAPTMCEAAFLPVVAGLLFMCSDISPSLGENISMIAILTEKYSSQDKYDEDVRMCAAKTLKFMGKLLKMNLVALQTADSYVQDNFVSDTSERVLRTVLQLLQDEDCDIREEVAKFVTVGMESDVGVDLNLNICLHDFLRPSFLCNFLVKSSSVFLFLWKILSARGKSSKELYDTEINNPFEHGPHNVYAEDVKTINTVWNFCQCILNEMETEAKSMMWDMIGKYVTEVEDLLHHLEMRCRSKGMHLGQFLHTPTVYFLVKKTNYQLQLLSRLCSNETNAKSIANLLCQVEYLKQNMVKFL